MHKYFNEEKHEEYSSFAPNQTGRYVVSAEVFCGQANCHARNGQSSSQNLKNLLEKYVILYGEAVPAWFFQVRRFDGEKYLPRVENKLSSLGPKDNFSPRPLSP